MKLLQAKSGPPVVARHAILSCDTFRVTDPRGLLCDEAGRFTA